MTFQSSLQAKKLELFLSISLDWSTLLCLAHSKPAVQCCGVCLSGYTVYEHDRMDKIRVDATWQHVHMQTFCMWDQGSEVDLLVHTKSCQNCAC